LPSAVAHLTANGTRFTPGGIRKGASGFDVCFIHPKVSIKPPGGVKHWQMPFKAHTIYSCPYCTKAIAVGKSGCQCGTLSPHYMSCQQLLVIKFDDDGHDYDDFQFLHVHFSKRATVARTPKAAKGCSSSWSKPRLTSLQRTPRLPLRSAISELWLRFCSL
jgi:hypothetical protein